jgi:hypothetical protein
MRTETIETLEDWNTLSGVLHELSYYPFQSQFAVDYPEGYQVRFAVSSGEDILVITHSAEVHDAIFEYRR